MLVIILKFNHHLELFHNQARERRVARAALG